MKKIDSFIESWFLPESVFKNPIDFRKAKVLVYLHLLMIVSTVLMSGLIEILGIENNDVPLLPGSIICLILLIVFKLKGNLILSGNLIAALLVLVVAPSVPYTGGLNSDNFLWLMGAPLIAMLFANKRSGFSWLVGLLIFGVYLYNYAENKLVIEPISNEAYHIISYSFLFIIVFGIAYLFEVGQFLIVKMLKEQKDALELKNNEIQQKNKELLALEEKLRATNAELEHFAYAASHDLKEPLRMIKMYTQLSQKRMSNVMDDSVKEFMGYVNEGTGRMQTLLDDLLQYSRMGKKKDDVKLIDLNMVLFNVASNLTATLKDTEAAIVANQLPKVLGSSTEMIQLFQNLIANSLKFRKKNTPPLINIRSIDNDDHYLFSLEDNGIGIKAEHQEKVFNIFERLHSRSEYEGSGIGLATVRKIVNTSGGKIWLESTEGVGTTFYFTMPKSHVN